MTVGITAFRGNEAPNILQSFEAGAATLINAKGAVAAVEDLFNDSGIKLNKEDYLAPVRDFYADSNGKMIAMPFNSSTPILYYNKAALEKAGVTAPKTWEEFEETAKKLKEAGYIALSQSHTPWIFAENFHSRHNIPMADKHNGFDGVATKINYNNDAIKNHFTKFKEWKDKGYFGYYGENWGDNRTPFEKGEVAMWLGSSGSFGGIKQAVGDSFPFATTFLPYWDSVTKGKEYNSFIGGAALFAFAGKPKAENACTAKFFEYLSLPETQVFWHKETGYLPITNSAYEKAKAEGYYKEEPAAELGILQVKKPGGEFTKGYRLGYYPQIRESIRRNAEKFFNGDINADKMFGNIEKDANNQLSRFARTVK